AATANSRTTNERVFMTAPCGSAGAGCRRRYTGVRLRICGEAVAKVRPIGVSASEDRVWLASDTAESAHDARRVGEYDLAAQLEGTGDRLHRFRWPARRFRPPRHRPFARLVGGDPGAPRVGRLVAEQRQVKDLGGVVPRFRSFAGPGDLHLVA